MKHDRAKRKGLSKVRVVFCQVTERERGRERGREGERACVRAK